MDEEWWVSETTADMEAGMARGLAKVGSGKKALTLIHSATGAWLVNTQANDVGESGCSGSGVESVGLKRQQSSGPEDPGSTRATTLSWRFR